MTKPVSDTIPGYFYDYGQAVDGAIGLSSERWILQ